MKKKLILVLIYTLVQFGFSLFLYWVFYDRITLDIIKGFSPHLFGMSCIGVILMRAHIDYFSK